MGHNKQHQRKYSAREYETARKHFAEAMSVVKLGNTVWQGRKHREESKARIGKSKLGKPRSEEVRQN